MNRIILMGRIVRDPEIRMLEGTDKSYTKFTLAVDRGYKSADGTVKADFVPITVWGKYAETIVKYIKKGDCISLEGRIRTGSFEDKEGNKKYIVDVIAEEIKFVSSKRSENKENTIG